MRRNFTRCSLVYQRSDFQVFFIRYRKFLWFSALCSTFVCLRTYQLEFRTLKTKLVGLLHPATSLVDVKRQFYIVQISLAIVHHLGMLHVDHQLYTTILIAKNQFWQMGGWFLRMLSVNHIQQQFYQMT